jgi:iron(III) transport system permease protein
MRSLARRILTSLVVGAIAVPLLALPVAALTDHQPGRRARWSAIPAALVLLDPLRMEAVWNSLVVATLVAIVATSAGFALARASWARPFWGRPVLLGLAILPAATMPLLGALGLRAWISGLGLESPPFRPDEGLGRWTGTPDPRWIALTWCQVTFAAPWIGRRIAAALAGVRESWGDAARMAGIGRWRAWRRLIWPLVRPTLARAASGVFVASLVEPGAPAVLGLRRTLASQIVEGVRWTGGDELPRAATLSVIAILVALAVNRLLKWRGREETPLEASSGGPTDKTFVPLAPWLARLVLLAWCGIGLVPLAGLILLAGRAGASEAGLIAGFDPSVLAGAARSALGEIHLPGALALGLVAGVAAWLAALAVGEGKWPRRALALLAATPPLALCVGIAALPALALAAGVRRPGISWGDPRIGALVPLVYGLALVHFPWALAGAAQFRGAVPARFTEAGRVVGMPWRSRAWRIGRPLAGPSVVVGVVLVGLQGAVGLSPGLATGILLEPAPLAPAMLERLGELDGLRRAVGPALLIQMIGLATLPVMAAWQAGPAPMPPRS